MPAEASSSQPLRTAFLQWERARVLYNVVLLTFGLAWSWPLREQMVRTALLGYWGSVLCYGFIANVFYTLGPAAEAYWHAFRGRDFGHWRWVIFGLGLYLSILATWVFVWSMEILYTVLYPPKGA